MVTVDGYTFEADTYCPDCTRQRFPAIGPEGDEHGVIMGAADSEGNEVRPSLACSACGEHIADGYTDLDDDDDDDGPANDHHYGAVAGGHLSTACGAVGIVAATVSEVGCPDCRAKIDLARGQRTIEPDRYTGGPRAGALVPDTYAVEDGGQLAGTVWKDSRSGEWCGLMYGADGAPAHHYGRDKDAALQWAADFSR